MYTMSPSIIIMPICPPTIRTTAPGESRPPIDLNALFTVRSSAACTSSMMPIRA